MPAGRPVGAIRRSTYTTTLAPETIDQLRTWCEYYKKNANEILELAIREIAKEPRFHKKLKEGGKL
jgi:hypothetical protein